MSKKTELSLYDLNTVGPESLEIRDDAYRAWVRQRPCLLADRDPCTCGRYIHVGSRRMVTEVAHVRSRGAGGGDPANIVPLCSSHHKEQHQHGIKTFERTHGLDLKSIAADLWAAYQEAA